MQEYAETATGASLKLGLLSLGRFVNERLVNMGNNSSTSNGSLDQSIELLISADGKLKMPGCDTLYLEILTCVPGKFENFGSEVFQDG